MIVLSYIGAYIASYLFAASGHYYLSGAVLIMAALVLYLSEYYRTGNLINLRGLFSLFFVGGEGISCLKLSRLQTDWEIITWISFFLAFMSFWLSYELISLKGKKRDGSIIDRLPERTVDSGKLFRFILALSFVSLVSFIIEAAVLGYIPLFVRGVPHAYSYFHISGLHYFTVSSVLIPAFSILWFGFKGEKTCSRCRIIVIICDIVALIIPILCVSRMYVVFTVVLAAFTYLTVSEKKIPVRYLLIGLAGVIAAFGCLTLARSHDAEYLSGIFEMKLAMPVDLARVYIYIGNNYDNFNCLVKELPSYSWGLRILFPLWALTGLKFRFPSLVSFPLYVTKEELTTVTLFYDYYYDFGVVGVFLAGAVIGAVARLMECLVTLKKDKGFAVIYAQFAFYMLLSFFTSWFSNPTSWFFLAVSMVGYLYSSPSYLP